MDTIFALATAPGKSGVAVIRLSGPRAFEAALSFGALPPEARRAVVRKLKWGDEVLDEALILRFDAPGSFTGEDVIELQLHGSRAIVASVLSALSQMAGLRAAEAGEFTRRALENDRLDLSQVEGLADLIDAETQVQRKLAIRVFSGALGKKVEAWRRDLIRAAALLEATIDFADEDVPVDVTPEVRELIDMVRSSVEDQLVGARAAERVRSGLEVAIIGPPNAGKSTLLNTLAGREAAITSEFAGTTRDIIEVHMEIGGLPVTLLDTAGLREAQDHVEALGIAKARERANTADLRIILVPPGEAMPEAGPDDIVLRAKDDDGVSGGISGKTGAGIGELLSEISHRLSHLTAVDSVAIRERHVASMRRAVEALGIAQDRLRTAPDLAELSADDLRVAIRALDALVGRIDVEDLLDEIFSSFCIGK